MTATPAPAQPRDSAPALPDDLCFPPGMVAVGLDHQLRAARSDLHRYIETHEPRTRREFGQHSMSPITYRAGLQARLSICHTLHALLCAQPTTGATP